MATDPNHNNPYAPPATASKSLDAGGPRREQRSPWRSALTGAIWSVVSAIPIAVITAILFRFPVPFAGYMSGIDAVVPALIAVLFYGVFFGGFVLLGALGAIGGFIAHITLRNDPWRCTVATRVWSLLVSTAGVLTLAVLDSIIGNW